jgi:hypothetical protein
LLHAELDHINQFASAEWYSALANFVVTARTCVSDRRDQPHICVSTKCWTACSTPATHWA